MDRQQVSAPNLEPAKKVEQEATVYAIDLQDNGSPSVAKTVSALVPLQLPAGFR